jgi:hypothetical protein
MKYPEYPVALGVIREVSAPTYDRAVESTPLWGSMPNFNTKVSTTIEACRNKDGKTILYKSLKYYKQLIFCQTHIFKISAHRLLDKWIPVNHPLSRHHVG